MSEELDVIQNAIELNRQQLVEELLAKLGIEEINENTFQELVALVEKSDITRHKYLKALESQQVVEHFLKDKLV